MGKPTFMVVGAQKAGTTWLFECLSEHPEIYVPDIKEVHFFSRPEDSRFSRQHKGLDWYLSLFPDRGYKATGELTPDYMYYHHCAEALKAFNPDLKLIFMLRDPVDRTYSAYWMTRAHRQDIPPFEEMIEQNQHYVARGFYYTQIQRFLALFPRDQIRIYIYEEVVRDPDPFFADVYGFLGVDPSFKPYSSNKKIGETKKLPQPFGFIFYKILSPVINTPVILPLWRFLRRKTNIKEWLFGKLSRGGSKQGSYEALDPAQRAKLTAVFREENQRLFQLLGRDVPDWSS